jgi:hypothetical protein
MNMFAKANAGMSLSPLQRAILRFVEGAIVATAVSMLPALSAALANQAPDWASVGKTALATFAVVVLLAMSKWAKAHGDAPLGQLATDATVIVAPHGAPVDPANVPDFPPGVPQEALGLPTALGHDEARR